MQRFIAVLCIFAHLLAVFLVPARATVSTGVGCAFNAKNCGNIAQNAFLSAATNVLQAVGFNAIGDFKAENGFKDGDFVSTTLHAAIGGLGGAIMCGLKCAASGALGAALGEIATNFTSDFSLQTQRNISQILGGLGSFALGDSQMTGATSALNGFEYNRQLHRVEIDLIRQNAVKYAVQRGYCENEADCYSQYNKNYNENPIERATTELTTQALSQVDAAFSWNMKENPEARAFLLELNKTTPTLTDPNAPYNRGLFTTYSLSEFQNATINNEYANYGADLYNKVKLNNGWTIEDLAKYQATGFAIDRALAPWEVFNGLFAGFSSPFQPKTGVLEPVTLNRASNGSDRNVSNGINFYVDSGGNAVPSVGYRAISNPSEIKSITSNGLVPYNPNGLYFTFNDIRNMTPSEIQSFLQLPLGYPPTYITRFNTLPILNDIKIPFENWNKGVNLEPITRSYPQYGVGGATQVITNKPIPNATLTPVQGDTK